MPITDAADNFHRYSDREPSTFYVLIATPMFSRRSGIAGGIRCHASNKNTRAYIEHTVGGFIKTKQSSTLDSNMQEIDMNAALVR